MVWGPPDCTVPLFPAKLGTCIFASDFRWTGRSMEVIFLKWHDTVLYYVGQKKDRAKAGPTRNSPKRSKENTNPGILPYLYANPPLPAQEGFLFSHFSPVLLFDVIGDDW
ncbi:unnamed protein product [Cuscuta epithymum]|uniref:Uncharacterized protein n=1 Tax=Cuscuta epithymum TaxID=186058 RepID=A0AAV0ELW6_9ASTE|nr:unnamed protein product [Cuscuta epithymum]